MVSNDILEYGRPGEVIINYTSGYGIEVEPEKIKDLFYNKVEQILIVKNKQWYKYQLWILIKSFSWGDYQLIKINKI